jgi:outer membrane protein
LCIWASGAAAADLPAPPPAAPPAPVAPALSPWFVKLGFSYAINSGKSTLWSQPALGAPFQAEIPGVGATVGNVATVGFEAGYYLTNNISLDLSGGIPMWADVKTKGSPPPGVPLPDGTKLASIIPAFVPATVVYHFNQFGAFQPYLGAGAAAVFSFGQRNAFDTDVTVDPTVGLVLQGGADVMLGSHWGLSFDAKQLFAYSVSHATGQNTAVVGLPFGTLPLASTLKTRFEPTVLSTGLIYRF